MAKDNNWPVTIFLKCHVNTIRQMFHRLCIHVIQKLRDMEKGQYLLPWIPDEDLHEYQPDEAIRPQIGMASPITGTKTFISISRKKIFLTYFLKSRKMISRKKLFIHLYLKKLQAF